MVNEPEDEFDPNEFKDNNCDSSVFRVPSSKSKVRVTRDETRGGSAELRNEVVMPPEFYQEVDTFLSREPPKLKKTSLASAISSFTFASSDQLSTHNRRGSKRAQTGQCFDMNIAIRLVHWPTIVMSPN